jgi:hypothetical protein
MWTILSGIVGGLFRLAPEFMKLWDRRNERAHELAMQSKIFEFQKLKGDQKVDELSMEGDNAWDAGALAALKSAIEGQDTPSGVKWIDGFSKLMRPLITFQWVIILYPGVIVTTFVLLLISNVPVIDAVNKVFGEPEKALVSFIVDFWFVGRILDAGRSRK